MAEIIGKRVHVGGGLEPFCVVTARTTLAEGARLNVGDKVRVDTALPPTEPHPVGRDQLLARLSDVLRRSGVEDAEAVIAEVEFRLVGRCVKCRTRVVGTEDRECVVCDPSLDPARHRLLFGTPQPD